MATKEEKEARDLAREAAKGAIVGGRNRAEGVARGALGAGPRLRSAGDLSRYNIHYTDDPAARAREEAARQRREQAARAGATALVRPRRGRSTGTSTTGQRTGAGIGTTATTKSLAAVGAKSGTLYEGRGDAYTGLTTAQARAVKPKKAPVARSSRQTGKRATGAGNQVKRQKAGGAKIKAKGTKAPSGVRQTLHTGITRL